MRLHKENLSTGISMMIFICLTIQVAQTLSAFTDVPRKSSRYFSHVYFVCFQLHHLDHNNFVLVKNSNATYNSYVFHKITNKRTKTHSLFQVHEYYAIIGRPRFGRSLIDRPSPPNNQHLLRLFDINGDHLITSDEFHRRLENE